MKKYSKKLSIWVLISATAMLWGSLAYAESLSIDQVVAGIEKRYTNQGFTASFTQQSTIKALQITDFAEGQLAMYYPNKMRWEYILPEQQLIIANHDKLWVYRPADNQVMQGDPRSFFSIGKGASFLSDIKNLRKNFNISFAGEQIDTDYRLKLIPMEEHPDIAQIILAVDKASFKIYRVSTVNHYGDTTDIELFNIKFTTPPESAFNFTIPAGVDVVRLDE